MFYLRRRMMSVEESACDRGQTEVLTENTVPALLRLPQIPKGLLWDRNSGHAVEGRRPSALPLSHRYFNHSVQTLLSQHLLPIVFGNLPYRNNSGALTNCSIVFKTLKFMKQMCTSCVRTFCPKRYEGLHAKRLLLFESQRD